MKTKLFAVTTAALSCLLMTGCEFGVAVGIDGLVASPKLTDEQSTIHKTLVDSLGMDITLKYPKNGVNRSAYLVADVDAESTDEALVFYQITNASAGDGGVRVNILDKDEQGNWQSVFDLAGKGTDVDKAYVSALGKGNRKNIIIGYSSLSMDGKSLQISRYDGKNFTPAVYEDTYSVMEILDIDKDGYKEIVTINNSNSTTGASASIIKEVDGTIQKTSSVGLGADTVSFSKSTVGLVDEETPAVFVDCVKSTGELTTEIITYKYNKLQNMLLQIPDKLSLKTTRPAGYYSRDINGDGIIEIPVTELMTGHENLPDEEKLYMTSWLNYKDYFTLEKNFTGYYSISDGYQFVFPKRWQLGMVTVKLDAATNEAVFYKYEGNISGFMTELMRIAVCPKTKTSDYLYEGYETVGSNGQLDYLVKLPTNRREKLILTVDEVKNSLYIL